MESVFEKQIISGDVIKEIIAQSPRNLENLEAELLFINHSYIFHYREGDKHIYKSLTPDVLRCAFNNESTDTGWLPSSVVRHGSTVIGDWVVSFLPPTRYQLQIEQEQLYIPLPSFVFLGVDKSYFVWAVKESRFNPQGIVHHAPLPNVIETGRICWGNAYPPSVSLSTIEPAWSLFINSSFNHDYTGGKSNKYRDIIEHLKLLHQKLQGSSRCRYPISDLVPLRREFTVEEIIEAIIKNSQ